MNIVSFKTLRFCTALLFSITLSFSSAVEGSLSCFSEDSGSQISYEDLMTARSSSENFMNSDLVLIDKAHSHSHHHRSSEFRRFGESVTISMTLTIPALSGPVPVGGSLDATPFAIAPNGKLFKGTPTNFTPAAAFILPLNNVVIPHPIKGNYVVGYFLTLGATSPVFSNSTIANFSGVILNNPVGSFTETITFPVQTLFLASSMSPTDVLTVSANFPIVHF